MGPLMLSPSLSSHYSAIVMLPGGLQKGFRLPEVTLSVIRKGFRLPEVTLREIRQGFRQPEVTLREIRKDFRLPEVTLREIRKDFRLPEATLRGIRMISGCPKWFCVEFRRTSGCPSSLFCSLPHCMTPKKRAGTALFFRKTGKICRKSRIFAIVKTKNTHFLHD